MLDAPLSVGLGPFTLTKTALHWINDGLMAVFFLLVGLEIKRELLEGELSDRRRAALPVIAAAGGMLVPAGVYLAVNLGAPSAQPGWPIPTATDIAFALGVLALLGSRIPPSLRVFLLGLAIIDDLGAIILIALLFTSDLSLHNIVLAGACVGAMVTMNRTGVTRLWPYLLVGVLLWMFVFRSGVHATLAGVVVALCVPLRGIDSDKQSPLKRLERRLHPWVTYGVMPLFAFANAGVSLSGVTLSSLGEGVPLGITLGLFLGKQAGVAAACWIALRTGLGAMPDGASWRSLYGVAILTGVGFTMSLFIGTLAFPDPSSAVDVRLGVLVGSILSALAGLAWLRFAVPVSR
jgi:NhaA family Na+:H+ antiporter